MKLEWEEKWRIEAVKECNKLGITNHRSRLNFELGYLQACRKRQEEIEDYANKWLKKFNDMESGYLSEIERLKEENEKLRDALTPKCGFSTII